jgi:hypothetical protein
MATRFTTTSAIAESGSWSPAADSILQLSAADPSAEVEIVGRVDASAPWVRLTTLKPIQTPFQRVVKMPFLKALVVKNTEGKSLTLWDNS